MRRFRAVAAILLAALVLPAPGAQGLCNDVETLLKSDDPRAGLALDYFALKVAQFVASMAAAIGGIDALAFIGGIGEHPVPVRDAIVARLRFLGAFEVIVIKANEELVMALQARACLAAKGQRS